MRVHGQSGASVLSLAKRPSSVRETVANDCDRTQESIINR